MSLSKKDRNLVSSKFFEVFNNLDADQLNQLKLFVESVGHRLSTGQKKRFAALIEERKNGRILNEHWAKTYIWKEAPNEWNKNKSAFQHLIDRFLLSDLRYKGFWGDYALLRYYQKENLTKNFNLLLTKCIKRANDSLTKTSKKKIELFLLYEMKASQNKVNRNVKRTDYLVHSEENLDTFYALQKLRMGCEQLNRKAIIGKAGHSAIDMKIIQSLVKQLRDSPSVQLYYNIYQLLKHPQKEHFYDLAANVLYDDNNNLPKDILLEVLELLMNYCIRKASAHDERYLTEYRNHIQFMEKQKILLHNGGINLHHYNNYISICLIQDDLKKVLNIIKQYGNKIKPEAERKEAKTLSQLRYHLYQLQHAECWQYVRQIHTSDKVYNFLLDKIYLKLFFLEDDYEAFNKKLNALRRKLDKERIISEYDRKNIRNLIKVLNTAMSKHKKRKAIDLKNYKSKLSPLDYAWLKKALSSTKTHNQLKHRF